MEVGTLASEGVLSPAVSAADIEKIMATAPQHGLQIVPPSSEG